MSDKKAEAPKPEGDAPPAPAETPSATSGITAWLPLLITVVTMPVLAFATTKFVILPKILHARETAVEREEGAAEEGRGESKHDPKDASETKSDSRKSEKGKKQTAQLTKLIVNVSGSMGSRYLMSSLTLAGSRADFKTVIEENKDQLLDLASSAFANKTITDLEKPGSRNQLRSELISIFNNALGGNVVQEIYFTEFAIQ